MNISPLQLEHSLIEEINLKPARGAKEFCESLNVEADPSFARHDGDQTRWQVGLAIHFSGANDKPSPYEGMIKVTGLFRVAETMPEERLLRLVAVNAPSILYSTAREVIAGLTARGINGLFLLPSVSFVDVCIEPESKASEQPDKTTIPSTKAN